MELKYLLLPERRTRSIDLFLHVGVWTGLQVIQLSHHDGTLPEGCTLANTTVYGETSFCRTMAAKLGGSVLEPANDFLPSLPWQYVHRNISLMPMHEARALREPKFIKPVNDKYFPARVYPSGQALPATETLDSRLVLGADPVAWECAFRLFVRDSQVVTASLYSAQDRSIPTRQGRMEAAIAFCETVLADKQISRPRAVVLDVGWILNMGWAVVEANTAVMSDIYDCDPLRVLEVLAVGLTMTNPK